MKHALKFLSFVSLAGALAVAAAFFLDNLPHETAKTALLWIALLWFATVPFWMDHRA
jgi:hypothetical protein